MAGPWEKYGQADGPWKKYAQNQTGAPTPAAAPAEAPSVADKVVMGMADPIHGGAQLLTKALPDSVVQAGNRLNNWLADKTGLVAKIPQGGVDQMVREREQAYQDKRAAAGESGFDGWRTAGNMVSPASVGLMRVGSAATSLGGRMAAGSATGAASNALAPVSSGDYSTQKRDQVLSGAVAGAAFPALGSAVSRIISPKASVNPAVTALRSEGITPTAGQILGGGAARTEDKLTSLPIVGDAIMGARSRAAEEFNRAVANRALKPVGEKLPAGLSGNDAVDFVGTTLGKRYDALLPNLTVKADNQFASEIGNLSSMVRNGSIDPKYASAFDRFMKNNVMGKFRGQNALTGQTAKQIESDLGQQAARMAQSQDPDARLMGDALREVQSSLRDLITRSNPQAAKELKAVNTGYANFKRLERAASSVAAEDGVFSPAQLHNAVKALDRSKDKGAFARGNALMQDLSGPAKAVLGSKVPNSGTADRSFMALAGLLDPRAAALALTAPVLYSQPGQKALAGLLATRPQGAQTVADALRQASPSFGLLGGQVSLGLLE